jgi:hypothetical protein
MNKDEALRLALEALERCVATCFDQYAHEQVMGRPEHFVNQAITAIKAALEAKDGECKHCTDGCPACDARKLPEQDWVERERAVGYREGHRAALAQRTWVGLKDKEIEEIWKIAMFTDYGIGAELSNQPFVHYAKAIEAKLKDKNVQR